MNSEVPCHPSDVAIVGGESLAELINKAPAGTSTTCTKADDGTFSLGDVVLAPLGDKSSEIAFAAMTRPDGQPPETCSDPANAAFCIIARRQIHFSKHEELDIRLDLRLSCLGKTCAGDQTCVKGLCVNAVVTSCSGLCDESVLTPIPGTTPTTTAPPPPPDAGNPTKPPADTGAPPAPQITYLSPLGAGAAHTCAITASGGVQCWGDNSRGELGNGAAGDSHVPVDVKGLTGVTSLAVGLDFSCALLKTGTVKCWGKNDFGELGNNANQDTNTPVDVQNLSGVNSLATGCKHVCVSTTAGGVKCWGWNSHGQMGINNVSNQALPVEPQGLGSGSGALFVTGGFEFSCAAFPNGAKCWGDNTNGQLGDNTKNDSHVPINAIVLPWTPIVLSAGASHVFAYGLPNGVAQTATWGQNPGTGGVMGTFDNGTAGEGYNCILRNGGVLCWGQNNLGQLGNNSTTASAVAVTPQGLGSGVRALRTGYEHACVVMNDNSIKCWGSNSSGQLGNNSVVESHVPVNVVVTP